MNRLIAVRIADDHVPGQLLMPIWDRYCTGCGENLHDLPAVIMVCMYCASIQAVRA